MKHLRGLGLGLVIFGLPILGCVQQPGDRSDSGWITLLDGSNLDYWMTVGKANWRVVDGVVQADQGNGYLVSKNSYSDFQIRAEFWVDTPANSGIFIRCADPQKIGTATCYDITNGKKLWDHDFEGPFHASPLLIGNVVHIIDRKGRMQRFEAASQFKPMSELVLGEPVSATPAVVNGRIYIRGESNLYAIGSR